MYSMVLPIASMALGFGDDEPDINIFMSYWFWCLVSTQWWWGPALSLFLLSHLEHLLEETVQYFFLKQVNVGIFTYCINGLFKNHATYVGYTAVWFSTWCCIFYCGKRFSVVVLFLVDRPWYCLVLLLSLLVLF
jgi:hypothetical protein